MADHVFYRTFSVQDHTISDKLGAKIAMIDVNFLLNKNDVQSRDLSMVDGRDIFVGFEKDDEGAIILLDKSEAHSMGNVDATGADKIMLVKNLINKDPGGPDKDEEYRASEGLLILNDDKGSKEKGDVVRPVNLGSVALPATEVTHTSCQSPKLSSLDSKHNDVQDKCVMIPTENGATQNFELSGFVDLMIEKAINYGLQDSGKYNIDDLVPPVTATDDRKSKIMRDSDMSTGAVENVKFKARPLKKLKIGDTAPPLSDNVGNNTQNYGTGGSRKALQFVGTAIEPYDKGQVTKDCNGTSNALPKKLKKGFTKDESDLKDIKEFVNQSKDEQGSVAYIAVNKASLPDIAIDDAEVAGKVKSNIQDKFNEKMCKVLITESKGVEVEACGCVKEVAQRPHDRSKWFTTSPWEERMKEAHDQGRLVLLQNLDATYTSSEVEDIVWHGFGESCTAKVVLRTATSNRFSAKALVIFKTREVAEKIVSKLDKECLMLPNSRPLLGSREVCFPGKHSPFPGHLVIDKLRHQKQRESREAVSTSHSSQSHTLEYEMAIEWCLLQHRSELWWNMLYKVFRISNNKAFRFLS
ncbi:unnamed protein product [Amaranthus hypochondriacus]